MKKVVYTLVGLVSISAAAIVISALRKASLIKMDDLSQSINSNMSEIQNIPRGRNTIVRKRVHDIGDMAME